MLAAHALLSLLLVGLLAACAGGSAEEARLNEARDAASSPRLPDQQATRIAERFFPPTPTAKPAPPAAPALESLVVTLDVGGDDAPQGEYLSLPTDAGSFYAAARLAGAGDGLEVAATLVDGNANPIATEEVELSGDAGDRWVALPLPIDGSLPPGEYGVFFFAGGKRLGSLVVALTAPGTAPLVFPDPPQNPVVDRGVPTIAPTGPAGRSTGNQGAQTPPAGPNQIQDPNAPPPPAAPGQQPPAVDANGVPIDPAAQPPIQQGVPPVDPNQVPLQGTGQGVPVTVTP